MDRTYCGLGLAVLNHRRYIAFVSRSVDGSRLQRFGFRPEKIDNIICWVKPFNLSAVKQVAREFPEVDISKELQDLLLKATSQNRFTYNRAVIDQDERLKPWQPEAARFIAERKRAYLALAPGLGKTLAGLIAADAVGYKRICVVCPLSLLDTWRNEIKKWLPGTSVALFRGDKYAAYGVKNPKRTIFVMGYEGALRYLKPLMKKPMDLIIFDESLLLKNRETIRFAGAPERRSKKTGKVLPAIDGVSKILADHKGAIWMMSGGPSAKKLDDLWAQLYLLDRSRFNSYWTFARTYCIVEDTEWGSKVIGNQVGAFENLRKDLDDIFYSRSQDEVGANLPEFLEDIREVDMSSEQAKIYSSMEEDFFAALPNGDIVLTSNLLTQLLRLNQIASNPWLMAGSGIPEFTPLWDAAIEAIDYVNGPVIIWTTFIETGNALYRRLKKDYKVEVLNGKVKPENRQSIADAFQEGKLDVLIAHPAVGKYGFTLTRARTAIYLERDFNGDNFYQSKYRIRRIGTVERPHVIYLLSTLDGERTVHHAIDEVLKSKHDDNISTITSRALRAAWRGEEVGL